MAGQLTLKGELEEELMEAVSLYSNFAGDAERILGLISHQETLDHINDATRNSVMKFLLQGLEAYNAKDYEGMQKYLHAAMQKLTFQGEEDIKDDKPRSDVKLELLRLQIKAIKNKETLTKLLAKISGRKEK